MNYVLDPTAEIEGTAWAADLEAVPTQMIQRFGAPHHRGDQFKISGQYIFVDDDHRVFTLYDWKATALFDTSCPSPLRFWNSNEVQNFAVGSLDDDAADFKRWLLEQLAESS